MKNINKFIAIVLCLLLVATSFATVSAEESGFSGIVSKNVEVSETGDVEVLIDIAGNPGITAFKFWLCYDTDVLTLKNNTVTDTGLLEGKYPNSFVAGRTPVSWFGSDTNPVNNYENGTIAIAEFEMKEGFYGTTEVKVEIEFAQNFVDDKFGNAPDMEDGIITVSRQRLAIKDGVAIANSVNGETLIIASYDEDSMVDCKVYPNVAGDVKLTIADEINTTGATKVKAFLWEDLDTLVPACNHAEEELNITDIN